MVIFLVSVILACLVSEMTSEKCLSPTDENRIRSSLKAIEDILGGTHCLHGWEFFDWHCYWFSPDKRSWNEAETYCHHLGGHLVKVESTNENEWLKKMVKEQGYINTWLGANDFQEGRWQWAPDLSVVTFSDWLGDQPDNWKGNEDCLNMQKINVRSGWNDIPCSTLCNYVCERNASRRLRGKICSIQ